MRRVIKHSYLYLAICLPILLIADYTIAQNSPANNSDDETFQRVFGRPRANTGKQTLIVPLVIDDREQATIRISFVPSQPQQTRLQSKVTLQALKPILRPEVLNAIETAIGNAEDFAVDVLQKNGIEAVFDERRLAVFLKISPAVRAVNVLGDRANLPPEAKEAIPVSSLSGYVNIFASDRFAWASNQIQGIQRQPLFFGFDGAINFQNWVLEGNWSFAEKGQPELTRGDIRIVRDDPDNAVRYLAGDYSFPTTGFQNAIAVGGIAAARNFSLQPYTIIRPINNFEFFLERPSKVEIYANGRLAQTLNLPAGQQDLRQLPLTTGINDIQLLVTDDLGQEQRINFSSAVASNLLAPNVQQFAYSFGFPSKTLNGGRNYDWSKPILSLAHRWGVSNVLTLGGYTQATSRQQLLGIEGIFATVFGNFAWDAAISNDQNVGQDLAWRLRYDFFNAKDTDRSFGFSAEQRGARFITFGNEEIPRNNTALDLSAFYRQKIFDDIGAGLNIQYRFGRDVPDAYRVGLDLSKSFSNGLSLNLSLSQSRDTNGVNEQRALLSMQLNLGAQSVQASTEVRNTDSPTQQVSWSFRTPEVSESLSGSLGLSRSRGSDRFTSNFTYTGYRAIWNLAPDIAFAPNSTQANALVSVRTAIAFADGNIALSRPISDSFALVVPEKALASQIVGVNPDGQGTYLSRADDFGAAVIPNLSSYNVSRLLLEVPDAPAGVETGNPIYYTLPTYKSGTVIRVGTDATVYIRGILTDAKGTAIALQAGEVRSLSDPQWQPITLFTNRAGKFALTGFKVGRYELKIGSQTLQFEVPEGKVGLYDLGKLKLPAFEKK
ncbi:fimbria/pilus outer membrane usher protein [Pseudanabaena yagii]|uniref:Fimbrial biogenesis outer membrane usher protein n=1 Tax=Pseudanabaena yagii GIHE-NHR1 TaxID=2722753 RepID=A0ABX1LWF9_9CYAN|nr:fimbria/pilus outer membrane usher protein [Pseudanabaena yagii]NMF60499.1 fimbrial biogenesis outer membrane usher protein [Pseudanabaena yagii GIHE-NHR1]